MSTAAARAATEATDKVEIAGYQDHRHRDTHQPGQRRLIENVGDVGGLR